MQLARVKLRHDLYDRRFAVFKATRDLLVAVFREGALDWKAYQAFGLGTADAPFLLDKRTCDYLDEIRKRAAELAGFGQTLKQAVGPEKAQHQTAAHNALLWLVEQPNEVIERFKPFLVLDNPPGWQWRRLRFRREAPARGGGS
jgi:hypothetical protein